MLGGGGHVYRTRHESRGSVAIAKAPLPANVTGHNPKKEYRRLVLKKENTCTPEVVGEKKRTPYRGFLRSELASSERSSTECASSLDNRGSHQNRAVGDMPEKEKEYLRDTPGVCRRRKERKRRQRTPDRRSVFVKIRIDIFDGNNA